MTETGQVLKRTKDELKDEMKDKISMALKDPILQQGFEIICKNLAELEKEKCELLGIIQGKDKVIQELKKELNKANEWHFVKDGEYPTHSNRVLVFTDEGVGFGIYGLDNKKWYTYDTGFDVIAWKEITLPKEIEK